MNNYIDNLTSFSDHLDAQYGKHGAENRKIYEEEFEAFKLSVSNEELDSSKTINKE